MIAVVYSGTRFADWKLAEKDQVVANFRTIGINPYFSDEKFIHSLLNKNFSLIENAEKIKKIYFFGAGASSPERKKIIENSLSKFFRHGKVIVEHDLQAAAIATSADEQSIVAIIASGSNAAYFNGKRIKENNYGLGFILGDEGSSNWLGKQLLKNYLNETLPKNFEANFEREYLLDKKQILDRIYKQPHPALFLSSFTDFLQENRENEFAEQLVKQGFNEFFDKYILPLTKKYPDVPVNFAGLVAAGFETWLREVAEQKGININRVVKEPIYNVLDYYSNKN